MSLLRTTPFLVARRTVSVVARARGSRVQQRPARSAALAALLLLAGMTPLACADAGAGPPAQSTRQQADILVIGGTVLTLDSENRVIENGGIAVVDGAIAAVDDAARLQQVWQGLEVIENGAHDIIMPGLVNGHGHAAMTLLRGVADDLALMEWLQGYIFPAEAEAVDEEFVRVGTTLAAMEMIRTGTTTFVDMYYFEDVAAQVVDEVGLRGILGETVIGFPAPDHATPQESLAYAEEFMHRWRGHGRVTATVAPHAAYTVDPEVLQQSAALARANGVPILIHLAETRDEIDQIKERYDTTPALHLQNIGLLGPDLIAAHSVWLEDGDIEALARAGVGTVHNPESNMKLASGTMRVRDLRSAGLAVGLGTDGAASNNDLDMFDAMTLAAFLQKHDLGDTTVLPAADVVAMATIEGARALGIADRAGSLEVGKRADVIVLDGDAPALVPRYDAFSHVAYAARGGDVRLTMVDGAVLYRNGEFVTIEPARVLSEARAIAVRIREIVGLPEAHR